MHIGIDAHAIGAQQGGNETYISNLIQALAALDQRNRYTIYLASAAAAREWEGRYANFGVRTLPPPTPLVRVPLALSLELRRRPVDVLHVQYTAPPFCPAPVIATIHDLAFEHLPETFTRRGRFQLRLTVRHTARRAAYVATVSEFSRQDILRTYGLAPARVAVTYNGVCEQFRTTPQADDERAAVMRRHGITRPFLLALGSLQPRKNLIRLLRAYGQLRATRPDFAHQLVIAGRQLWLAGGIMEEIRRQPWSGDVIVTGYVPDADLPALYRATDILVYPSLFEGFGLPPLEAMACGTPVITSNTSSLPEVVGDAAVLIDPLDENAMAETIYRVTMDDDLKNRLRRAGPARARQFTWRAAAEKTLALYEMAVR
ncbi:MAG: glycosyltransferase family 4 protein [Blastocatellia bacterium]